MAVDGLPTVLTPWPCPVPIKSLKANGDATVYFANPQVISPGEERTTAYAIDVPQWPGCTFIETTRLINHGWQQRSRIAFILPTPTPFVP
jgi:hypothetical protein